MKKFELNGLGKDWIWEAESEEQATKYMIEQICPGKDIEKYYDYCREIGVEAALNWKEILMNEDEFRDFLTCENSI